ncbi:MAG: hypothetical protein AAF348_19105 [Bacteroidota bacterium]
MFRGKKSFYRELAIAIILFLTPLLGYVHVLEPDGQLREITLLGWRYIHDYQDDQMLLYYTLRLFKVTILYGIWYITAKSLFRLFLLFPIWFIVSELLLTVMPTIIYKSTEGYLNITTGTILTLFYVLTERRTIMATGQKVKKLGLIDRARIIN